MSRLSHRNIRRGFVSAVVLAMVALGSQGVAGQDAPQAPPAAQDAPPQAPGPIAPPSVTDSADGGQLTVLAGRSIVLTPEFDIRRFSVTNPDVADGTVISPRELLIDGKAPGTISLILWGTTLRVHYQLVVEPTVTVLEQRLRELFPGEDIRVTITDGAVILSGDVSSNEIFLRTAEISAASLPDRQVINMLQLPGGLGSQQVVLQVRVAEVNRKAVQELGLSLFTSRPGFTARATTQQFSAPNFDEVNTDSAGNDISGLVFSDYLNIFFFQRDEGIGGVLRALNESGDLQSLAEPNLIAYNGQPASFLAGGEIPVPVVSGNTGNVSVTWKEFGVLLNFVPHIAGDVIRLHVMPEVSSLDFANGITLSGFRIPALTTRRAETEVELRDGQSFAIAGLLNNIGQTDTAAIPLLSKIPIIGSIFRSRAQRQETTELMVLVTPRLVRPLSPDEVPPLPTTITPLDDEEGGADEVGGVTSTTSTRPATSSPVSGGEVAASTPITGTGVSYSSSLEDGRGTPPSEPSESVAAEARRGSPATVVGAR